MNFSETDNQLLIALRDESLKKDSQFEFRPDPSDQNEALKNALSYVGWCLERGYSALAIKKLLSVIEDVGNHYDCENEGPVFSAGSFHCDEEEE